MTEASLRREESADLHVYFDPQIFLAQASGGISRYFTEVLYAILQNPDLGIVPTYWKLPLRFNRHSAERMNLTFINAPKFLRVALLGVFAVLRPPSSDLTHHTFYFRWFNKAKRPSITTVHDLIPELLSQTSGGSWFVSKGYFCETAAGLIFVSNSTLDDYKKLSFSLTIPHRVIHHATSMTPSLDETLFGGSQYLLFVGNRDGYKNGSWAIRVMATLPEELLLIMAGPSPSPVEVELIKDLGLVDRVIFITPSDDYLRKLYSGACMLLYPTSNEGFGLPLIEAIACGTPVVAFDNKVNREVAGSWPTYFSELSFQDFQKSVKNALIEVGANRYQREHATDVPGVLSWSEVAKLTADLYWESIAKVSSREDMRRSRHRRKL